MTVILDSNVPTRRHRFIDWGVPPHIAWTRLPDVVQMREVSVRHFVKNKVVEAFEIFTSRFKYDRVRLRAAINTRKTAGFPGA